MFMTVVLVGLGAILLVYLFHLCHHTSRIRILVDKLPGPKALPLLGNALDFYFNRKAIANQIYGTSGTNNSIVRVWLGVRPLIYLSNADDIREVLSGSAHINKSPEYAFFVPWLENNMFTSSGDEWRKLRKLVMQAFNFRIVEGFSSVFNAQSRVLVEQINKQLTKQDTFDVLPLTTLCVFDILCETLFGCKSSTQLHKDSVLLNSIDTIKSCIHARQLRMHLWPKIFFNMSAIGKKHNNSVKLAHKYTEDIVKAKQKEREIGNENGNTLGKKLSILDLLLDLKKNGASFSDAGIRAEIDGYVFAGHDTISTSLGWILFLMGTHPHVQKKLHQEIDEVFGGEKFKDLTVDDLKNLPYMDCVIKESLRRFTPVPLIGRKLEKDVTLNDGRILPAGVAVYINIFKLHKDPIAFPNPEKFDPDRFLPENSRNQHPYAFIPFSAGPRNCMGQKFAMMEEKIILAQVLHSFSIKAVNTLEEIKIKFDLILNAGNGINLQFTPRVCH